MDVGRPALLSRLAALVLAAGPLAACKGGTALTGYENPNAPPGPADAGVLSAYWRAVFTPGETAAALALLGSDARYMLQRNDWWFTDAQGNRDSPVYASHPLKHSGSAYAHATGLTGAGQTVVVVDAGFRPTHEAIAGQIAATIGAPPEDSHGTAVASVVAGASGGMIGIAPGAALALGGYGSFGALTAATDHADAAGAVAQNNSWGFGGAAVTPDAFASILGSGAGADYYGALAAYTRRGPGEKGGVVVFAVSNNESADRADLMAALPFLAPELEAGWIAAANAVPTMAGENVTAASLISAPCLEAARWCLLADGTWTAASAASDTSYDLVTGSSFAAPQVSGALALLAEAFPALDPQDLRVRLLASAQDGFFTPDATVELAEGFSKGYSHTYGMGFLDIRAALLPIGPTTMATAGGARVATDDIRLTAGSTMGDAVTKALGPIDIAVTDSLGAGFVMPGAALAGRTAPLPLAETLRAEALSADLGRRRTRPAAGEAAAFAAYPGRTLDFAAPEGGIHGSLLLPTAGSYGLAIGRTLDAGDARLDIGLRLAHDGGQVFGLGGAAGSEIAGLTFGLGRDSGAGFLALTAETGLARIAAPGGVTRAGEVRYDSLGLALGGRGVLARGDRLTLGLALPVAVRAGRARMTLPVALSAAPGGAPAAETREIAFGLAPEARQIDLSLDYQLPLGRGAELLLGLRHAENFGNQAGLADTAGVLALQLAF